MKSNFTKTNLLSFSSFMFCLLITSRLFATGLTLASSAHAVLDIHTYTNGWLKISQNMALGVTIVSINNVTCNGGQDGTITALAIDGVEPYSYLWSNGATTAAISGLAPGTYTVTVTDASIATAVSVPVIITEPFPIIAEVLGYFINYCDEYIEGAIYIYADGGVEPYTYLWNTGSTTSSLENLVAGIYTVTVTGGNGCTQIHSQEITLVLDNDVSLVRLDNVTCHGLTDGLLEVTVLNPVSTNNYIWSNGFTGYIIGNLAAGNYTVTVSSNISECMTIETYTITQPEPLFLEGPISGSLTCHNSTDAELSFETFGGSGDNTYLWSTGETTEYISNVGPGIYGLTITDSNGCTISSSANVSAPDSLVIDLFEYSHISCSGDIPGLLSVQGIGGHPNYQYLWPNGGTNSILVSSNPGTYTVTVIDAFGCTATNEFTLVRDSTLVIGNPIVNDIICGGDSIGSILLPNTSGVTYRWGDGREGALLDSLRVGDYTVTATDAKNCVSNPLVISVSENPKIKSSLITADTLLCTGEANGYLDTELSGGVGKLEFRWNTGDTTNLKLENLMTGNYYNRVVDSLGCIDTFRYAVLTVPTITLDSVLVSEPNCYDSSDGSIALLVSGGYQNLTYLWTESSTDSLLRGIKAGDYQVTVTDANSCNLIRSLTLTGPDSLTIAVNVINETLEGNLDGQIEVSASGGTAPYSISWMSGETSFILDSLTAGSYDYVITDANGCTTSGKARLGVGQCTLSFTSSGVNPTCHDGNDGEIVLNLAGINSIYEITLRRNGVLSDLPLSQLGTGTYEVTVTDSLGCTFVQKDIVLVSANPAIVLDEVKIIKPTSTSNSDGTIEVVVSGGLAPLSYRWTMDGNVISTTQKIENLMIGVYNVEVIDAAGCALVIKEIKLESVSAIIDLAIAKIELFPNPTSNELNITTHDSEMIKSVQFYDISGTRISEIIIVNTNNVIVDLYAHGITQNGVYIVKIALAEEVLIKKVILLK